jgi:hypothetical protein
LNYSVWLFVDVRIIAVAEIISTRLSLADLYACTLTLSSPATIVGGTAISTLATALAPTARIISNREFSLINIYVAFAIATPVAWSVNARCEADCM